MDSFSLNTLNKYINNYKHDIILKLSTEKLTDKNISSQANLVNMVLDYSPKTKSTFQFTEKIDISKFREKHQVAKKSNKPSFSENSINNIKYRNEESYDKKNSQKEENKNSISEKSSGSANENHINNMHNLNRAQTESLLKIHKFENIRLRQRNQIRIYVLSKSNYFEIEFSPKETISSLKKKIYTKILNSVNITLKHSTIEAYEIRPTKGMNVIYFKPKHKQEKEKEISSRELKEKCSPDMNAPSFDGKALIKDLDIDALCFIEKEEYKQKNDEPNIDQDSLVDDNKKIYGEYITDTGENQINCKVFIKIGDYSVAKVVKLYSNSTLRDVFEKISNSDNIKEKNSEFYYFVEHSEENDNENMDEAIYPDLEIKYLYPYILDLYKKKFADVPNISRKNNFGLDLDEKKNDTTEKKQDYVLNDATAGVYQEFSVIKINSHNKRQERILGIDLYNLKNEVPKNLVGIFSRKKAKIQERKIKDIQEIKDTGEKTFEIIINSGEQGDKTLKYEAPDENVKNEIIAKLNYIMKMNNI